MGRVGDSRPRFRRLMRTRFSLLLLAWLVLPLRAWALEPQAVLPEGCEPAVLAWLRPLEMDRAVTDQWLLRDIGIDHSRLQLTLEGPAGRRVRATVSHVRDAQAGETLGEVRLDCPAVAPPEVCAALRQGLTRQPRAPLPWIVAQPAANGRTEMERSGGQFSDRDPTRVARGTLIAVWLMFAAALLHVARRHWRAIPRLALLGVGMVTLLGLAARLALAPRGLQHELFHAGESLAFLHGTSHFANGEAVPALVNALNAGVDGEDATLFAVTLVFAVLAIPALVWFTWQLTGRRQVALLAGLLLALSPIHVHFSASEEFGIVGLALALVSCAAWLQWLRTPSHATLLLAAASGVLAMQSRPELLLLPLLHLTLLWVLPSPGVLRRRALWFAVAFAVLASWHVPFDVQVRGGFPGLSPLAIQHLVPRFAWLDPELAVWPMAAWLLLGLAFALREAPRQAMWLAGWSLFFAVLLLALYTGAGAYAWRMQLLPVTLGCVLTAWATLALPGWQRASTAALALTALLQLVAARETVAQPSLTELQYRFQRAHVAVLPPGAAVLAVLSASVDHPPPLGGLSATGTRLWRDVADPANLQQPAEPLFYLQSAACWLQWPGETRQPRGLHPACQAVHDHFRLQPLAELDLPPTHEPPLQWAPAPGPRGYRIGFYRLLPR